MLEIKNLVKTYSPKGVTVRALDGVSIKFPETGMVFLVGKSGSGKSTLLNVSGGLDVPTDGEIIVNGRSSKTFTPSDFDSYRNTFIGFVFQEYNILEEFTIAQNIELALQLQNKPCDKTAVSNLLEQVDLGGMEKRKPNTLSGGQRQRVAIARALIKNPKIIMADEPTGALDASTGRQIFDTLKKLSQDRLVLVVSHDKEFAREYADRIIELVDGKVSSDVLVNKPLRLDENVRVVNDSTIIVKNWASVTESDLNKVVSAMKNNNKETIITSDSSKIKQVKHLLGVKEEVDNGRATEQRQERNGGNVEFIKSRLPLRHAIKMAFNVMKTKPIRLCFTIILAVIAFTFFGVSSSLMLYDPNYSIADALYHSDYEHIAVQKEYDAYFTSTTVTSTGTKYNEREVHTKIRTAFTREEVNKLNDNGEGLNFAGVIDLGVYENDLDSVSGYVSKKFGLTTGVSVDFDYRLYYVVDYLCGFSDCGAQFLEDSGFPLLAGRYPENHTEIAIPEYIYNFYNHSRASGYGQQPFDFNSPEDILGLTFDIGGFSLTVCGVYDVGEIAPKYNELYNKDTLLDSYAIRELATELKDILEYSFHTVGFVSDDFYDEHKYDNVSIDQRTVNGLRISELSDIGNIDETDSASFYTPKSVWQYGDSFSFYSLDGQPISSITLSEKQVLLSGRHVTQNATQLVREINDKGVANEPKCAEFLLLAEKIYDNSYSNNEFKRAIELIFELYPTIIGEPLSLPKTVYAKNLRDESVNLEVMGFYIIERGTNSNTREYFVSDELCDNYGVVAKQVGTGSYLYETEYETDWKNEPYGYVLTKSDNKMSQSYLILNGGENGASYAMTNILYKTTKAMADIVYDMKVVFSIATVVFGAFAMLMLFNFITVSIQSKSKEIGILRAVGARRIDVFKIFIAEALFITVTCFLISTLFSALSCAFFNVYTVGTAVKISLFNYGIENILMSLGMVILVSCVATGIPVVNTSRKSPVESIRAL